MFEVLFEFGELLKEIIGLDAVTFQPSQELMANYAGCLLQKNILKKGKEEEKSLFLIQLMVPILPLQQSQDLK